MTNAAIKARLEYLRRELRAERISYDELHELQSLAKYIDAGDVELLEAAGVPETPETPERGRPARVIVEVVGGVVQSVDVDARDFVDVQIVDWDEVQEGAGEWLAKLLPWVRERLDAAYPDEMERVRKLARRIRRGATKMIDWDKVAFNSIIGWVRSSGPDGDDIVPMYYKGRWLKDCVDGRAGDVKARPVSLGMGLFTATYNPSDFVLLNPEAKR